MGNDKKNSFSFDDDPGALENNVDFSFDDVPVLGKKKGESFDTLFQEQGDEGRREPRSPEERAAASFEALLTGDTPNDRMEEAFAEAERERETDDSDVVHVGSRRRAKRKTLILIGVGVALFSLFVLVLALFAPSESGPGASEADKKEKLRKQKAELAKAREKQRIDSMLKSAGELLAAEKPDEALSIFNQVLSKDSRNALAKAGEGRCLAAMGKSAEAKTILESAIDSKTKDPVAYVVLARILLDENPTENADKAKAVLMSALEKFPKNKNLASLVVGMAKKLGDDEVVAKALSGLNVSDLDLEGIKIFGSIKAKSSRARARKIYLYGARRFKSFDLYMLAVDMSDTSNESIEILEDALKVLKGEDAANKGVLLLRLAQEAMAEGDEKKAIKALDDISDISALDHDAKAALLHMRMKLAKKEDVKEVALAILRAAPKDTRLGVEVQRALEARLSREEVFETFSRWQAEHPGNPVAEFLYAKSLGPLDDAIDAYKKALVADPTFFEPNLELGKLYMTRKKWDVAERYLAKCVEMRKDDIGVRRLWAMCVARRGKGKQALEMMSAYLDKLGLDSAGKAAQLIDIALVLPSPADADEVLADLKSDPKRMALYREKNAERKLLFGGAEDSDFKGARTGAFRRYHILYLLTKGCEKKVLMMPTPKEDFPEFWKTFLARKWKLKSWKNNAWLLVERAAKDPSRKIEGLIAEMWLGKLSPEDAEKRLPVIPPEKLALFYFVLGDAYLAEGQSAKAYIRFRRALAAPRSVERGVVRYFIKKYKGM